ncbi:probable glutathione S-transferase GSTF1 [Typha latifolia]|uniref:probable glutathione S-transferase GSTF1 n=1 Tax=Typha latifolia TaxID=4733 RepID=UPI003C2C0293
MVMKVYGSLVSSNVVRVLVCLEEAGAEYELVPIDFAAGEHKSPAHLARNPFGQVPVLQDGDLILFESRAISRYILRKHKSTCVDLLKVVNLQESALVDQWLEVEAQKYDPAVSPIVFQLLVLPMLGGVCDQAVVDAALPKLEKVLDVYEARLSKSKYLAGDSVTLADLSHVPLTYYFMGTPYASIMESYPNVKKWWEALMARPAMKKVAATLSTSA